MLTDDLFIMKLSPNMIENFDHFGYTTGLEVEDGIFKGYIHRFAVFYEPATKSLVYTTIKKHTFDNKLSAYRKLYTKLNKDNQYRLHDETCNGEPILDDAFANEANLHI